MKRFARIFGVAAGVLVAVAIVVAAFVWSGYYNVGADDPHTRFVASLMETARDRSIAARSAGLPVPKLDDPEMVTRGAGLYSEMCVACHLAPGVDRSELRAGLYPQPPELAKNGPVDAAEAFWIVKHGIKMTAMPAWGISHDDAALWDIVAFLRAMPAMSSTQYQQLIEPLARQDDHGDDGHHHVHGATPTHQH